MSTNHSTSDKDEFQYDSFWQLLVERLYWFAIGPLFLVLLLLGLLNDEAGRRLTYNVVYLVALAGLPLSRWLDLRGGRATTANGTPATWAHFRKYALLSVAIGLAVLLVVNAYLIWSAS